MVVVQLILQIYLLRLSTKVPSNRRLNKRYHSLCSLHIISFDNDENETCSRSCLDDV